MIAVDLFAGWGGFTTGAEQAGVRVVWAANHWPLAVSTHAANHPGVEHACQDLRQADWRALPRFDLLLASPACQGHSPASQPGRRPHHDALRATAWAVIDCVEVTSPRAAIIENVLAFRSWTLFPLWLEALRRLGYVVGVHRVDASRLGVPQRRARLFVTATRRPVAIAVPAAPEPAFGPCVDWDAPGWRSVRLASPGAQRRIAALRTRHLRGLVQHVTGHRGVPLDEPIRTITTKDHWAIVDGDRYRPLTIRELARGMGFPESFTWPVASRASTIRGIGNAVCPPVARDIVRRIAEVA